MARVTRKENEVGKIESFEVQKVREVGRNKNIFFTLILNGVAINNCSVVHGRNGDFISLPQYKGSDDKYYNTVYFRFSEDDTEAILDEVSKQL